MTRPLEFIMSVYIWYELWKYSFVSIFVQSTNLKKCKNISQLVTMPRADLEISWKVVKYIFIHVKVKLFLNDLVTHFSGIQSWVWIERKRIVLCLPFSDRSCLMVVKSTFKLQSHNYLDHLTTRLVQKCDFELDSILES